MKRVPLAASQYTRVSFLLRSQAYQEAGMKLLAGPFAISVDVWKPGLCFVCGSGTVFNAGI